MTPKLWVTLLDRTCAPITEPERQVCFHRYFSVHFQSSTLDREGTQWHPIWLVREHSVPLLPFCEREWPGSSLHRPSWDAHSQQPPLFSPYGFLPHSFIVPLFLLTHGSFSCQLNDFGSEYLAVLMCGSLVAGSMTSVKAVWKGLHFKTHPSFLIPQNLHHLFQQTKDY